MPFSFYKLPLDIHRFLSEGGGQFEHCSELESIDQFLGMLLMTVPGEHAFNEEFGSRVWDLDFENITSKYKWEAQVTDYIRQAVETNEKRLRDIEVQIDVRDVMRGESPDAITVRKQLDIYISGTLISTDTRHGFKHSIFMGPISNS